MERFDKKLFNEKKINGSYYFTLPDGSLVNQFELDSKSFIERITKINSPYESYKEFYYENGALKNSGSLFYDFSIGIWTEYDNEGNIITKTNEDVPYIFTIIDLDKKMREMNINIMDSRSNVLVTRNNSPFPYYKISVPSNELKNQVLVMVISAVDGEIISKRTGEWNMK